MNYCIQDSVLASNRFDKELQKLERKEKLIEKERQKLEKMRMKLDTDGKIDTDFFQKMQDWDMLKSRASPSDPGPKLETSLEDRHSRSGSEKSHSGKTRRHSTASPRERIQSDGSLAEALKGEDLYAQQPESPSSPLIDEGTSIDLNLTMETIAL